MAKRLLYNKGIQIGIDNKINVSSYKNIVSHNKGKRITINFVQLPSSKMLLP